VYAKIPEVVVDGGRVVVVVVDDVVGVGVVVVVVVVVVGRGVVVVVVDVVVVVVVVVVDVVDVAVVVCLVGRGGEPQDSLTTDPTTSLSWSNISTKKTCWSAGSEAIWNSSSRFTSAVTPTANISTPASLVASASGSVRSGAMFGVPSVTRTRILDAPGRAPRSGENMSVRDCSSADAMFVSPPVMSSRRMASASDRLLSCSSR